MLVFPQLTTGAAALYPVRRRRSRRSVRNVLRDGSTVVYLDPDWRRTEWDLDARGWTEGEWRAVEDLFLAVRGAAGTFTFLEPAGNLLRHSEAFEAAVWDKGPLVTVHLGLPDPVGGANAAALTNAGPTPAELGQTLAVPGEFTYALSVWVRSGVAGDIQLFAAADGAELERTVRAEAAWRRVYTPVSLGVAAEAVRFGVRLNAGQSVELFGMQVEAQPGMGDYQKTEEQGGVYPDARFGTDVLNVRARATDQFDATIRIVSKGG
jgi:hypothetical protein